MLWSTDPFRDLDRIRREMDRVISRVPFLRSPTYDFPLLNLYDNKDSYTLVAEIPGVKKEDLEISLDENAVTLSGKREAQQYGKSDMLRQEQPEGSFSKTIRVSGKLRSAEVKARYEDGILTMTLPKAEEAKPRQITVE